MEKMNALPSRSEELEGLAICRSQGCGAVIFAGEYCRRCEEEIHAFHSSALFDCSLRAQEPAAQRRMTLGECVLCGLVLVAIAYLVLSLFMPFGYDCLKQWGIAR